MDDVGLKVVLSSEVRGAVNGVNNVNVALNEMGKTAAAAADKTSEALNGVSSTAVKSAKGFGVYSRSLADVSAQQKVLATQARAGTLSYLTQSGAAVSAGKAIDNSITPALKQLSKTGVNSNGVLIDMSRVAQDLPFGFIAIQNNIAPLIESFGRMSREAGGAGAAFKALGGALLGPAGIGFAISTVTSLITFAVQKYGSLGAALSALNPFTASVVGWQRDLNDAITKSAEAAGSSIAKLQLLRSALSDFAAPQKERLQLLEEYNKSADEGNKLDKDQINNLSAINELIDRQITLLGQRALATAAENKLSAEASKLLEVQIRTKPILDRVNNALMAQAAAAADAAQGVKNLRLATPEQAAADSGYQKAVKEVFAELAKLRSSPEYKAAKKELQAAQEEFYKQLGNVAGVIDPAGLTTASKATTKTAKEIYSGIDDLNKVFGASSLTIDSFWYALSGSNALKNSKNVVQGITDTLPDLDAGLSGYAAQAQAKIQAMIKPVTDKAKDLKISLNSALSGAFSGLGEAIGSAISGGGLQGALNGVLKVFATFIKQMGESLIAAGTAMLAAKILIKNPVTAIAAGVAAVAISAALEAKINKSVPRYATGGMAIGPQLAIVGDNPGGREAIIPSEDFDQLGGVYIVENHLEGSMIVQSYKRALAEENRIR